MLSDYFVAKNDDLNLERHVLAPGVDFLNHAGVVEGGASYEYFGDQFAVRAHDDLRQGDEAFASYGAKSNALLLANYGFVEVCVEINQCVGRTRQLFTKSFLGDDAAVLAPSSGKEPASPRHRAGVASMAWRTTR